MTSPSRSKKLKCIHDITEVARNLLKRTAGQQNKEKMEEKNMNSAEEEILNDKKAEETAAKAQEDNPDATANSTVDNDSDCTDEKEGAQEEEPKDPLTVANEEIAALKDKYLRAVAEFDNYRKRTLKEKAELILNGGEKAITAILPVIDDLERAIENGKKTDDLQILRDGVELIFNKLIKTLEGLGVKRIDTTDADFNTDLHEAIAMVPGMGEDKKGKVLDCVQTGYKQNEKVIRHAKVAVGQ